MSDITWQKSAIDQITEDDDVRRWLKLKQDMPAIVDECSDAAIDIWCTRP